MMPVYQRLFFETMLNALNMLCAGLRRMLEEDKRLRASTETRADPVRVGEI